MLRQCEGEDRACAAGGGRTLRTDVMRDDCRMEVRQSSLFKEMTAFQLKLRQELEEAQDLWLFLGVESACLFRGKNDIPFNFRSYICVFQNPLFFDRD